MDQYNRHEQKISAAKANLESANRTYRPNPLLKDVQLYNWPGTICHYDAPLMYYAYPFTGSIQILDSRDGWEMETYRDKQLYVCPSFFTPVISFKYLGVVLHTPSSSVWELASMQELQDQASGYLKILDGVNFSDIELDSQEAFEVLDQLGLAYLPASYFQPY